MYLDRYVFDSVKMLTVTNSQLSQAFYAFKIKPEPMFAEIKNSVCDQPNMLGNIFNK